MSSDSTDPAVWVPKTTIMGMVVSRTMNPKRTGVRFPPAPPITTDDSANFESSFNCPWSYLDLI